MINEQRAEVARAPYSGDRAYDSLRISIRHVKNKAGDYFQSTLDQPGSVALGGPFRQHELFQIADVQALRKSYDQQLRMMHELAALGVAVPPIDMRRLIDLGRRVAAVLPQTARQSIVAAVQQAQRGKRGLRITLEVAADDAAKQLLGIPWELMVLPLTRGAQVDTGGEGFLLLNADVTLVRQVQGVGRNTAPLLVRPIKLQALAAAPAEGMPIDTDATWAALDELLLDGAANNCWYDGRGTLIELEERLRETNPQILHLLCHGEQSDTGLGVRSDLLFTHRDGYVQRVSAFDLAPLLTLAPDLQLVVLQACHAGSTPLAASGALTGANGANETERLAVESIALAFVRQGVAAVVAMQGAVGQEAAAEFVRVCYRTLGRGGRIEQAVAAGRIAMWAAGSIVDWSLPVVYQGSGLPDPETWYTRLADRIESATRERAVARALRGGAIALALLLLASGVVRWLLLPPPSPPALDRLTMPLAAWGLVGLVGPAVVAAAHRGVRDRSDLTVAVRRTVLRAQWAGAYLGYGLGGMLGMLLLLSLWITGVVELIPPLGQLLLFAAALLSGLFLSYTGARSQVHTALALGPFHTWMFSWPFVGLIICVALVLLAAPFGVFLLPGAPGAFLLDPAPAALVLALALITMILRG